MVGKDEENSEIKLSKERTNMDLSRYYTQNHVMALPKEFRHFVAGGIAGMTAKSLVAPVDRIKILYQVSSKKFRILEVPRVAQKILQSEGIDALWKGNTATMIRVFPYSGIQFMVFDRCKTWFLKKHAIEDEIRIARGMPKRDWGLTAFESLFSGSAAGICSVILTYPLDMARTQLAVMKSGKHQKNLGLLQLFSKNYAERGFMGLYRGIIPTTLGILPYAGVAFTLNEQSKRYIQNMTCREASTIEKMQCGAISGLFAQTFTYPLEVVRRRIQTVGISDGKNGVVGIFGFGTTNGSKIWKEVSMSNVIRQVYKEQGFRGFFKGVSLNWIKGPIAFSISFTTFDIVQGLISTDSERLMRLSTASK